MDSEQATQLKTMLLGVEITIIGFILRTTVSSQEIAVLIGGFLIPIGALLFFSGYLADRV